MILAGSWGQETVQPGTFWGVLKVSKKIVIWRKISILMQNTLRGKALKDKNNVPIYWFRPKKKRFDVRIQELVSKVQNSWGFLKKKNTIGDGGSTAL